MRTDFRALCAELANTLYRTQEALMYGGGCTSATDARRRALVDRARAALAQPEPPADGEVIELVALIRQIALAWEPDACLLGNMTAGQLARAADLLERLAQPEPVGPTDEELKATYWDAFVEAAPCGADESWLAGLRAVARLGRRAPQPEPVGATDEELRKLAQSTVKIHSDRYGCVYDVLPFARAVLARWGRPATAPIPVSEQLLP